MMQRRDARRRPPRPPRSVRRAGRVGPAARRLRGWVGATMRRFGMPIAFVLAGFLVGLGYAVFAPTTYTATAFVLVVDAREGQSGPAAVSFAQAYGRLAPLPETLAYSSLPLPDGEDGSTREHIQASTSPDTPLIKLSGSGGTARDAAAFANAAADALVRYGTSHRSDTGVRVALMTLAEPPAAPSSPNLPLGVAVGTASGILLAGLAAAVTSGRRGRTGRRERGRIPSATGTAAIPGPVPTGRVEVGS